MIVVIGSANMDLVVPVRRLPIAGETLLGGELMTVCGGKGANQAIAAARLGAHVEFIGCVGNDDYGRLYAKRFGDENVGTTHLRISRDRSTGVAMIVVDDRGDNMIVVSPGANHDLSLASIDAASDLIAQSSLLLVQFEIPFPVARHAITIARKNNVPVMLNASPVHHHASLAGIGVDYLVLNQVEAECLSGITSMGVENLKRLTDSLREFGSKHVIMTRGSNNTIINSGGRLLCVPTLQVQCVDSVGAGDTFAGALAVAISEKRPLPDAVRFANCAAALATLKSGAQTGMPHRSEVEEHLRLIPA